MCVVVPTYGLIHYPTHKVAERKYLSKTLSHLPSCGPTERISLPSIALDRTHVFSTDNKLKQCKELLYAPLTERLARVSYPPRNHYRRLFNSIKVSSCPIDSGHPPLIIEIESLQPWLDCLPYSSYCCCCCCFQAITSPCDLSVTRTSSPTTCYGALSCYRSAYFNP